MKYAVKIKWQCLATVEAESEEDAINCVLHSAMQPKLTETSARPAVNGKAWMHATATEEKRTEIEIAKQKRNAALPRWKEAHDMKRQGKTYRQIMAHFGRKLRTVAGWVENSEAHLLKLKGKA